MSRTLVLLALLAACDRVYGLDGRVEHDAAPESDAPVDPSVEVCGGIGLVRLCAVPLDGELRLRDTIDTDSDERCLEHRVIQGATNACVIAANRIEVMFAVRAIGARPLVLFATTSIQISAVIDVASHLGEETGAGARIDCDSTSGTTGTNAGGGGAGGTHQFKGGPGGNVGMIAPGVDPRPVSPLSSLVGGCAGGAGGGAGAKAKPGAGGGAFYAIAGESIAIDAIAGINASGAAGAGGTSQHGGGGGGSGGLVGLDAPSIAIAGNVIAKGGAGGGGGDAGPGLRGKEALLADPQGGVYGGAGGGTGGSGGDGSNGTVGGNPGGTPTQGAGGGGGAAGYVLLYGASDVTGILNPPPPE